MALAHAFIVRRKWISDDHARLDASSYGEGAQEVRDRITERAFAPLSEVARVFRGPLHKRVYVDDPIRGIPYLTASAVVLADPDRAVRLSRRRTPELPVLAVEEGWTLISSAGNVGNCTFVREELARCAISQDMIRVAPNALPAGYVYAFLSTAGARKLIRHHTYGSVVDRIEPKHLFDLPVPLPDEQLADRVHGLVLRAARARTDALARLDRVCGWFDSQVPDRRFSREHQRALGVSRAAAQATRLDAFPHVGWAAEATLDGDRVDSICDVISTARVPRVYADRGVPFLSGIDVFRLRPVVRERLAAHVARQFGAVVRAGQLAVQGSGQRYGLLGRVAFVGERLEGWSASHDLFRLECRDPTVAARVFAFFRSDVGRRAMLRHSYGTSIPHVNPAGIASVRIPAPSSELDQEARRAIELREQAVADDDRAILEVEQWLAS